MCAVLKVHPSGYYEWLRNPVSNRAKEDQKLAPKIKQYWLESGCVYGYRNIHKDLTADGIDCGRDRVLRLMQESGIKAERGYNSPRGMYGGSVAEAAPNHLNRQFTVTKPNEWWVSDITYIKTQEGFLFVAVIMDLFSRAIVGWSMDSRMKEDLIMDALIAAYWRRKPQDKVMLHSDQGSQYKSANVKRLLAGFNITPSMSRKGNCWDNAVAESFFANLKKERIKRKIFKTRSEAKQDIFNYIEMFYNPTRRHTNNDRMSPKAFETDYFKRLEGV